jgi:hypothetical protein
MLSVKVGEAKLMLIGNDTLRTKARVVARWRCIPCQSQRQHYGMYAVLDCQYVFRFAPLCGRIEVSEVRK